MHAMRVAIVCMNQSLRINRCVCIYQIPNIHLMNHVSRTFHDEIHSYFHMCKIKYMSTIFHAHELLLMKTFNRGTLGDEFRDNNWYSCKILLCDLYVLIYIWKYVHI
jgi:hypothetical protein